jgi:hypothetical protein
MRKEIDYAERRSLALRGRLAQAGVQIDPVLSSWDTLQVAGRYLNDIQHWASPVYSMFGGDRHDMRLGTHLGWSLEKTYLLTAWAEGRAEDYAAHLRINEARREGCERTLRRMEDGARAHLSRAPESAVVDPICIISCEVSRIDLQKRLRTIETFTRRSAEAAQALCAAWTELSTKLEGTGSCEATVKSFFTRRVPWSPMVEEEGEDPELADTTPPGRDPAAASVVDPIHVGCVLEHDGTTRPAAESEACIRAAFSGAKSGLSAEHRALISTLERLGSKVCVLDGAALTTHLDGHSFEHCDWLLKLRLIFWAQMLKVGDASGLAAHVKARAPWGHLVRGSLGFVPRIAAYEPCEDLDLLDCRAPLKNPSWAELPAYEQNLQREVDAWTRQVCDAWPELEQKLEPCTHELRAAVYSYSSHLFSVED